MRWSVLVLFVLVLVEVRILSALADAFGGEAVLLLVLGGGVLGWWMLRRRWALRRAMTGGPDAARWLGTGLVQIAAAVLFLVPGVVSDVAALLLLVLPAARRAALPFLQRRLAVFGPAPVGRAGPAGGGRVIDREAVVREPSRGGTSPERDAGEPPREEGGRPGPERDA